MKLDMYEMDIAEAESKATYQEIKKYVVVLMKEEIIHRWEMDDSFEHILL